MNTNEFEAWLSRNVRNIGKGGKRPSADPFNKALKGSERNKRAEEYPYGRIEGYHHYSERYSQKKRDDDQQNDSSSQSKSEKKNDNSSSKATRNTSNLARNIVSRVVAASVGAVVVVSSYQTMQANAAAKVEPVPVVATERWTWNEDLSAGTVKLLDSEGVYIAEIPATVTVSQNDPTCTKEGAVIYTATAEDEEGNTYSDTKQEPLEPTGHIAGEWTDVVLEDGETAKVSECTQCHQKFVFETTVIEE